MRLTAATRRLILLVSTCALSALGCVESPILRFEDVPGAEASVPDSESAGVDLPTCGGDECWIDDVCYYDGELNARVPCRDCAPTPARTSWSLAGGGPCDDGGACTVSGSGRRGVCRGAQVVCDDGDACTLDRCDPAVGCVATLVSADDGNPCTLDLCHAVSGIEHRPVVAPCEDGDPCTLDDACRHGVCVAGPRWLECSDDDVCTADACEAGVGCRHEAVADCDDTNPCTVDTCDSVLGCVSRLNTSGTCRPIIVMLEPGRGARLRGDPLDPNVAVVGRVRSDAGDIVQVTVNGRPAALDDGVFTATIEAHPGGNTLVIVARDAMGTEQRRVQAFHFAARYAPADRTGANALTARAPAHAFARELSAIASYEARTLRLEEILPGQLHRGRTHQIRITRVTHAPPRVVVTPRAGGLHLRFVIDDLRVTIEARGTRIGCVHTRIGKFCPDFPDLVGVVRLERLEIAARAFISAHRGRPHVELKDVSVSLSRPSTEVDGQWPLASRLGTMTVELLSSAIETRAARALTKMLSKPLERALSQLSMHASLDLEALEPGAASLRVGLDAPIQHLRVDQDFIEVVFGARTSGPDRVPWPVTGVMERPECPGDIPWVRGKGLEVDISDDLVNRVLNSAWRAGLLEFDVDSAVLGSAGLERFGVTDLRVRVSGMLPPVVSDCNPSRTARLHVGDLSVVVKFRLVGQPVAARLHVSFEGALSWRAGARSLRLVLVDVEWVDGELNIAPGRGGRIVDSRLVAALLRRTVVPLLAEELTGSVLAEIPLPRAALLTGALDMDAVELHRRPGGTVLRAVLGP